MRSDFVLQSIVKRHVLVTAIILAAVTIGLQPWAAFRSAKALAGPEQGSADSELHGPSKMELLRQTKSEADAKSVGCIQCHQHTGDPHEKGTIHLGCVDC